MRFDYRAVAHHYTLLLTLTAAQGYNIVDLKPVVTAYWMDGLEQKSKTLELQIPQCVYDAMSDCPNVTGRFIDIARISTPDDQPTIVYYSTCDGRYLGVTFGN